MNTLLQTDGYKTGHIFQYPKGTEYVYSNWTPRKSRIPGIDKIVHFGLQHFIKKWLIEDFDKNFFNRPLDDVLGEYKRIMDNYLGPDSVSIRHIKDLHDLGYLPLKIKSLPEGSLVPMRCPAITIVNTDSRFYWLTNYIETLMSAELWMPTTSATIAKEYREILDYWCEKTGGDPNFVQFQGHDFSMRGMAGVEAAKLSGMGHLLSFVGTDTIPAILDLEKYYGADSDKELIGCSVPATEHAVMCAGKREDEFETFRRLVEDIYPSGIVSIVSDTWDLWEVLTNYLPRLKDKIITRNGKLVIRPDSGDPVDILCGIDPELLFKKNGKIYKMTFSKNQFGTVEPGPSVEIREPESKGVIELLWDVFGGTINDKGYKVLDPHIGAIYGDSITLQRAEDICKRLEAKGFCSTNVVFGIGSFTYQYNTRDTFGFAMKATWCQVNGKSYDIFKDPVTDDGTKKSAKGLIKVVQQSGEYVVIDQISQEEEQLGRLELVFENGKLMNPCTLSEIRNRLHR